MWQILKQSIASFIEDDCPRIAAALAYYTVFSLAPMLVVILSVCQLAFDPSDVRGQIEHQIEEVVGDEGAEQIKTMLKPTPARQDRSIVASLVGLGVMLFGATGLFTQLQAALNDIWKTKPKKATNGVVAFLVKRIVSLGMLLTVAFLMMVSIAASAVLKSFDSSIDAWLPGEAASTMVLIADYIVSLMVNTCLFAAMFRFLPDIDIQWRQVWVGATVTSILFLVGKFAIAIYVGNQSTNNMYGAAGSLVILLMWVYYSALIFLLGAQFTRAYSTVNRHRSEVHAT